MILGLALTAVQAAEPPTAVIIGTPPQPTWMQLSPVRKAVLAPLNGEWDQMDNLRRKKWLGIADRFASMKPDEQQRTQHRMREWVKLTPEQRNKARDSYKDFKQLPPEQKQLVRQKWEAYANLPTEEKQRVRESGKSSRLLAPIQTNTPPSSPPTTIEGEISTTGDKPAATTNSSNHQ
nr:DUF3106 domain-containing protein [Dechloromonas sp.]